MWNLELVRIKTKLKTVRSHKSTFIDFVTWLYTPFSMTISCLSSTKMTIQYPLVESFLPLLPSQLFTIFKKVLKIPYYGFQNCHQMLPKIRLSNWGKLMHPISTDSNAIGLLLNQKHLMLTWISFQEEMIPWIMVKLKLLLLKFSGIALHFLELKKVGEGGLIQ